MAILVQHADQTLKVPAEILVALGQSDSLGFVPHPDALVVRTQ